MCKKRQKTKLYHLNYTALRNKTNSYLSFIFLTAFINIILHKNPQPNHYRPNIIYTYNKYSAIIFE